MPTTLKGHQERLKALVEAEPLLAGSAVKIEDKNNLTTVLETALAEISLCVIIAPARGTANSAQSKKVPNSQEQFDVVIHRSLIDSGSKASTVEVLDALVPRIHGAPVDPAASEAGLRYSFIGHELRENGDGTYARAITFGVTHTWPTPA